MKKLILLLLLSFGAMMTYAQSFFSCNHRSYYRYNSLTEDFDFMNGYDESSLFELNKNLTMFTHTTPTIESSYYIKDSSFDEDNGILSCEVISDVGNKYTYVFALNQDEIRVLSINDDDVILIVFNVKKMWNE